MRPPIPRSTAVYDHFSPNKYQTSTIQAKQSPPLGSEAVLAG